jgi:hypothetical protein
LWLLYSWVLVVIIFMGISDYSIHGYWWLFYSWLFVAIIFMAIGGYLIHGYLWLFYSWLFDALLSSLLNYGIIELGGAPDFQHYKRVEGRARSPGIRLGRGTRLSSLNLHPKPTTRGLVSIREHPWVLGQATGTLTHLIHHGPDSGEATTFPHIVFSALLPREPHPNGSFSRDSQVGVPKLSRVGVLELWELISPDCRVWSRRGLNQSCSSLQ